MEDLHKHYTGFTLDEQNLILDKLNEFIDNPLMDKEFYYPDYGGIPEELNSRFSTDLVDGLQYMLEAQNEHLTLDVLQLELARGWYP
jgi:hypothetical protein